MRLLALPLLALHLHMANAYFAGCAVCRVSSSRAPRAAMLFDGLQWPWDDKKDAYEPGKFQRHSELQPGCAPLGVVCAGFSEDALEALADVVEYTLMDADGQATKHVPIAVLDKRDLRRRLRDVLAQLDERDSVLPDQPSTPRAPLVLLSGFSSVATSATVRAVRELGLTGGSDDVRPMFAVAVPNALDKPLAVLIEEIEGDHLANRGGEAGGAEGPAE